jgi:hypothetical protein
LISSLGIAILVVARLAAAHPHLRHATGTLSVEIRDDNNAVIPARLTFRPVGDAPGCISPRSTSPGRRPARSPRSTCLRPAR